MRRLPLKILSAPAALLLTFCSPLEQKGASTEEQTDFVRFTLGTKAGTGSYTDTTYLASLYNYTNQNYCYYGTYCGQNSTDWCIPCEVDSLGEWQQDGIGWGLRPASNTEYYFVLSSPAVRPVVYKTVSSRNSYGFPQTRTRAAGEMQYISSPKIVTTSGVMINGVYVYDVPDEMTLREHRSKLDFKVR